MIKIENNCTGSRLLPLEKLQNFQGSLKKRGDVLIAKLVNSIKRYGFIAPFFVWNDSKMLDGHGRLLALQKLQDDPDVELPASFPVVDITADDEATAKKILLQISSAYGITNVDAVAEFMSGVEYNLSDFSIPNVELPPPQDLTFGTPESLKEPSLYEYRTTIIISKKTNVPGAEPPDDAAIEKAKEIFSEKYAVQILNRQ